MLSLYVKCSTYQARCSSTAVASPGPRSLEELAKPPRHFQAIRMKEFLLSRKVGAFNGVALGVLES